MLIATWIDAAWLLGPGALGFVVGYAAGAALPGKGRGLLAFAIPVVVTLGYVLVVSLQEPNEASGIVEWVIALAVIIGLELGVFIYSLRHRNPRTPTQPQQYLS